MKEMEKMGTIKWLSDQEVKNLEFRVHHFNELDFLPPRHLILLRIEFYVIRHLKCQIQAEFSR